MKKLRNYIYNILTYPNYIRLKKKFNYIVFLHTPQSAGNSMDHFLKVNLGIRNYKVEPEDEKLTNSKYKDYFIIFGHFGYDRVEEISNEKIFKICNIRNPKNRYLSNYYRNRGFFKDAYSKEFMSLKDFLILRKTQKQDNLFTRYFSGEKIYGKNDVVINDEHLNKAKNNLKTFDHIFIVENSKSSFKSLSRKLDFLFELTPFFDIYKNKVSASVFKDRNEEENKLLNELTFYDQKLYDYAIMQSKKND